MFPRQSNARFLPILMAVLLAGCGDALPVAPAAAVITPPGHGAARRSMTEQDAFATADPYYVRDVLAPFGGVYDQFFSDPEAITDGEFEAQAPYSVPAWEVSYFEADAYSVNDYCTYANSSGGGGGGGGWDDGGACPGCQQELMAYTVDGGGEVIAMYATCEQQWERCWSRCRRIWNARARALCWGACAASYALCVRRRRGG